MPTSIVAFDPFEAANKLRLQREIKIKEEQKLVQSVQK
jgi:hypothetical protein